MSNELQKKSHLHLAGGTDTPPAPVTPKDDGTTKIKKVEHLIEFHGVIGGDHDDQTSNRVNRHWRELREAVDSKANRKESNVKGKLVITIDYTAEGMSGKKMIKVKSAITLPEDDVIERAVYEAADGTLQLEKPTKQTKLPFDDDNKGMKKGI